jgi:lipopolysaccharide/colanic/teichoic acid biosynthesis glycosyltransferase
MQSTLSLVSKPDPGAVDAQQVVALDRAREARARTGSAMYLKVKRGLDLGCCLLMSPLVLPVFAAVALAVRLSSPGSVFYRKERVGRAGRKFTIYKFRSMYTREHLHGVLQYKECETTQMRRRLDEKHLGDPRVTPIGRLLRKFSLDELPQLINVVRGEMALVGPRPVVSAELQRYGVDSYFYKLTTPGLTGLWQVSGRNDVTYEQRVRLDAEYCSTWTLWLDTKILARTIPAVMRGKGAY